jgi:hypothetical protein
VAWTRFRSPASPLVSRWERASGILEPLVRGAVGDWKGGAAVADAPATHEALLSARALLAMGERDAPKDLVRAVALALRGGRVEPAVYPALRRLLADFRAWTGDVEFLARYADGWSRLGADPQATIDAAGLWEASADPAVGWGVVGEVVERLFGLGPDAEAARLRVRPALPADWRDMALTGIRVGPTMLDLLVRRRPGALVIRATRTHGPRLRLEVEPPGLDSAQATVDDVPLGVPRAAFELAAEHEVRFDLA